MSDTVTEEDITMIQYFHQEMGDITRWVHWEEKKEAIFKMFPMLLVTMNRVNYYNDTLNLIIDNLEIKE